MTVEALPIIPATYKLPEGTDADAFFDLEPGPLGSYQMTITEADVERWARIHEDEAPWRPEPGAEPAAPPYIGYYACMNALAPIRYFGNTGPPELRAGRALALLGGVPRPAASRGAAGDRARRRQVHPSRHRLHRLGGRHYARGAAAPAQRPRLGHQPPTRGAGEVAGARGPTAPPGGARGRRGLRAARLRHLAGARRRPRGAGRGQQPHRRGGREGAGAARPAARRASSRSRCWRG